MKPTTFMPGFRRATLALTGLATALIATGAARREGKTLHNA